MERIAELDGIVTGFHVTEEHIDCMCGKKMIKLDKAILSVGMLLSAN